NRATTATHDGLILSLGLALRFFISQCSDKGSTLDLKNFTLKNKTHRAMGIDESVVVILVHVFCGNPQK
ncbi:hypothetical protein V5799_016007, partial [Amblyomma americanum]